MKTPLLLWLACVSVCVCVHLACCQERAHIFVNQKLTQSDAQKYCQENHDSLSSILTPVDHHKLMNLSSAWTWIGLTLGPQNWTWTDGSKATYFKWSPPNTGCAAVSKGGLWVSWDCNTPLPFLCQDTKGQYVFRQVDLVWEDALVHCQEDGMTLATFKSPNSGPKEWPNSPHWMGLQLVSKRWAWVKQEGKGGGEGGRSWEDLTYTNWQTRLYCALMERDGEWRDAVCDDKHWSVCAGEGQKRELVKVSASWSEAQRQCESKNMTLVTIRNAADNTLLQNMFEKDDVEKEFWIGLSNNPWRWPDGTSAEPLNWAHGQPNNHRGSTYDMQECVVMGKGMLYDTSCSSRRPFFCLMKPVEKLEVVSAPSSWEEALLHCWGLGGHLARVGGGDDQLLVQQLVLDAMTTHVWIGLRFLAGEWLWESGEDLTYLRWSLELSGQVKCPLHHCGAVERNTGRWVPRSCDEKLHFLCQLP